MAASEQPAMPEKGHRAILTDREREILDGEADVDERYYYRVVTRVRKKINRMERDLEIMDRNHDTLGDELREIVCDDNES